MVKRSIKIDLNNFSYSVVTKNFIVFNVVIIKKQRFNYNFWFKIEIISLSVTKVLIFNKPIIFYCIYIFGGKFFIFFLLKRCVLVQYVSYNIQSQNFESIGELYTFSPRRGDKIFLLLQNRRISW